MSRLLLIATGLAGMCVAAGLAVILLGDPRTAYNFSLAAREGCAAALDATVGRTGRELAGLHAAAQRRFDDAMGSLAGKVHELDRSALDASITAAVRMKLLADESLSSSGIHVRTDDGVVSLQGNFGSNSERDRAVELAQQVEGVVSVDAR